MSQKFNDEYIQIQNEIDRLIKLSHQYRMMMYSVVSLILAYLLTEKNIEPLAFLVPAIIIFIFYFININFTYDIYFSGAYLNAFYEEFDYKWEKRLNLMRNKKLGKYSYKSFEFCDFNSLLQYRLLLFICFILYFYKCFTYNFINTEFEELSLTYYKKIFFQFVNMHLLPICFIWF